MTWFRVDDEWFCHPKVMGLGLAARGLWVTAGSWCANRLTDGFVPTSALSRFGATKRHASELVAAGLWTEVENGYQFWDWLHFQPSKEKVLADREATSRRVSKHRNTVTKTVTNTVTNGHVTQPPVPVPVPVPTTESVSETRAREAALELETVRRQNAANRQRPPPGNPPPELPPPELDPSIEVWAAYEALAGPQGHPTMNRDSLSSLGTVCAARALQTRSTVRDVATALLGAWLADDYVRKHKPSIANLAKNPGRYLSSLPATPSVAKVHPKVQALNQEYAKRLEHETAEGNQESYNRVFSEFETKRQLLAAEVGA